MTEQEALASVNGLVHFFAKKWYPYVNAGRVTYEDLIQAGMMGVVRAYRKFDAVKNPHFPTYASFWIKSMIAAECLDHGRTVHVPIRILRAARKSRQTIPMHACNIEKFTELEAENEASFPEDSKRLVRAALGLLSERERQALTLRYLKGKTLQKVGDHLGITREGARIMLNKALSKLQQQAPDLQEQL